MATAILAANRFTNISCPFLTFLAGLTLSKLGDSPCPLHRDLTVCPLTAEPFIAHYT